MNDELGEEPTMAYDVYGKPNCPYCDRAKDLLESKGIEYKYIDVTQNPDALRFIKEEMGMRTVPQIFQIREDADDAYDYEAPVGGGR